MNITAQTKKEWLPAEKIDFIRRHFFPENAREDDIEYCLEVAKNYRLDPILKQIYFVPRRKREGDRWIEKVEPLAGRDAFLTIAHRSGKFAGIESTAKIENVPALENGKWVEKPELVGCAKVWRTDNDKPFVVCVEYSEYVRKDKNGNVTSFWEKPLMMIKKVAESQALRKAFNIGLYDEAEFHPETDDVNETIVQPEQPKEKKEIDPLALEQPKSEKPTSVSDIMGLYKTADTAKKQKIASVMAQKGDWRSWDSENLKTLYKELEQL